MADSFDRSHIPQACGIYIMRDALGAIIYIGKANNLAKRVAQYFNRENTQAKNAALVPLIRKIDYIPCASEREALILERRLIYRHQPFFNVMWKDNKSYPWLKITLGEDYPRLMLVRKKSRDGGVYFGPYPKVSTMKSLMRALWRQGLFPLRPCRWEFSREKPLEKRKISACLYYHTKECPAPCAGRASYDEYRRIAEQAALFFRGRYKELEARLSSEMEQASREMEYERAAQLRDNIEALGQMGERVRFAAVTERDIERPVQDTRAVTDLQAALGLADPPHHIECFDISHFQGRQTAASMVCFMGGKPHKEHYRRFRVRAAAAGDIDDFKAMAEVVGRRYRRLVEDKAPLPDLVLIDGGKGQLSSAVQALREAKARIPAASLAKRLEEVFLPGREESMLLDPARPALRLLQRLRDEAHRFGVGYHRLLRDKAMFGSGFSAGRRRPRLPSSRRARPGRTSGETSR